MLKTATVRARIEPELKEDVELILSQLGLNASESIHIFFRMIRLKKGLPFPIEIPNKTTRKAMAESTENLPRFDRVETLLEELDG